MKKGFLLAILGLFLCVGQASADLYTLSPTADAYFATYTWGGASTVNGTFLETGYRDSLWNTTLLKFDVSSLSGQTITGATLNLYNLGAAYIGSTGTTAYYSADNSWTETSILASTVSGATTIIGSNTDASNPGLWQVWNLTLQPSMLTGGTLSIAIKETGPYDPANWNLPHHQFASRESGANIPYLSVTTLAPVPIPAAVWLLGSGLIGLIGIRRRFKK